MLLTRREILAALLLTACTKKQDEPSSSVSAASSGSPGKPAWPRTTTHAGVEMIELFPQDADEKAPLIVAIHGMGDRPQHWVEGWKSFPARAQIVLPRAFTPYGDGYSWFKYDPSLSEAEKGPLIGDAEARLWPALVEVAAGRKLIVTGFSQGGMLSWVMAARHADRITAAFPVAGMCPSPLRPKDHAAAVPVVAFHGTADQMVPTQWDRDTVAAFKANGNQADLREFEGVGHAIPPQLHSEWWAKLVKAVKAA